MNTASPVSRSSFRAWLQLFRVPNLFTVPGDPLAGFLLAWDGKHDLSLLGFAVAASLCFYSAGLLWNDLADFAEDRAERPQRPLPSGATQTRVVWIVSIVLIGTAIFLSSLGSQRSLLIGCGLASAIALYNFATKKIPIIGPLNMGLCRGLSVLLGASFAGRFTHSALLAAGVIACYIAAVTNLARHETRSSDQPASARWWPLIACSIGFLAFYVGLSSFVPAGYLEQGSGNNSGQFLAWAVMMTRTAFFMFFFPVIIVCAVTAAKVRAGDALPPLIGLLIRALIFMQAAFCASMSPFILGILAAIGVVALWPISHVAGRRFYAS